jgi:alkanesulfonate monooxygenase SsuD/methylene tetrahydromethanopterin reductase-like flavin-dependent oxidoreductase (luciferase family)
MRRFTPGRASLAGSRCDIPLVGSPEIGEPRAWAEIGGTTPAALRDCETTPQSRRVEISNINYETEAICYLINLETLRGSVFIGSPDTVVGKLKDLQRDIGLSGVQLETNCAGLADHAAEREAIRLLAREVKSAFR